MQDSFVPLVASAGAFLAVLVWRVRPLVAWRTKKRASREAFLTAQSRVEGARDDRERAAALCDAGDILVSAASPGAPLRGQLHSVGSATALYLRAMRADPSSVAIVDRAVAGLSRRPRALESLLWRRLAIAPWKNTPEASRTALDALRVLYEGRLRNSVRARALANARDAL
jgi:hypothetical protein